MFIFSIYSLIKFGQKGSENVPILLIIKKRIPPNATLEKLREVNQVDKIGGEGEITYQVGCNYIHP